MKYLSVCPSYSSSLFSSFPHFSLLLPSLSPQLSIYIYTHMILLLLLLLLSILVCIAASRKGIEYVGDKKLIDYLPEKQESSSSSSSTNNMKKGEHKNKKTHSQGVRRINKIIRKGKVKENGSSLNQGVEKLNLNGIGSLLQNQSSPLNCQGKEQDSLQFPHDTYFPFSFNLLSDDFKNKPIFSPDLLLELSSASTFARISRTSSLKSPIFLSLSPSSSHSNLHTASVSPPSSPPILSPRFFLPSPSPRPSDSPSDPASPSYVLIAAQLPDLLHFLLLHSTLPNAGSFFPLSLLSSLP